MKNLAILLFCILLLYICAARTAWEWRNPKGNRTTFLTHLSDSLTFRKLDKFQ